MEKLYKLYVNIMPFCMKDLSLLSLVSEEGPGASPLRILRDGQRSHGKQTHFIHSAKFFFHFSENTQSKALREKQTSFVFLGADSL